MPAPTCFHAETTRQKSNPIAVHKTVSRKLRGEIVGLIDALLTNETLPTINVMSTGLTQRLKAITDVAL